MTWNHRVVQFEKGGFGIVECFYTKEGEVYAWTSEAIPCWGETEEGLRKYYDMMGQALSAPVLVEAGFKFAEVEYE